MPKKQRRKRGLSKAEEAEIVAKGLESLKTELYGLILKLDSLTAVDLISNPNLIRRINSLGSIYFTMAPDQVRANLVILMARKGIYTLLELSKRTRIHHSTLVRMINQGHGSLDINKIFCLAKALDARPELMLLSDLRLAVGDAVINWQTP